MMKKVYIAVLSLAVALPTMAQETYENAKIGAEDLNGTARYVGMGGAMEALGADISTIGTNPAGIGMFRKSTASLSFGLISLQDAQDFAGSSKTRMSFDQVGFVYSSRTGASSFMNIGFNYHKSRNFGYILSANDRLYAASQNKLTYAKAKNGLLFDGTDQDGTPLVDYPYASCNQLDDIYTRNLNFDTGDHTWYYDEASAYTLDRNHKGYVGEYDFNLSGNINNRVYLGMTIGIHDVHYKHYGEYQEQLNGFNILVGDDRQITGTGFDIKLGAIFRPVEESPFRLGLSVSSPTMYDLTTSNYTSVNIGGHTESNGEAYDFKLYTPWRFGLSLGHTIGQSLALGASYEYADYGSMDTRYKTGEHYDWWSDSYYDESESDEVMNRHTEQTLKGVSTLKLGLEYKPAPELAVRLGYNYVSPMYDKDGFKDGTLQSDGSYYSSATDYTNWGATNRLTCGLGYTVGDLRLDVAYQYSATSGDFYPFMNYVDNEVAADDNLANAVKLDNKRHQLLFTLSYSF